MSFMTQPLWKNEYIHDGDDYKLIYEYDEDNYVVSVYRVDSTGNVRLTNGYRYETANWRWHYGIAETSYHGVSKDINTRL